MIKGDRDIAQPAPAPETSTGIRRLKYPFLNLALALALTPAVLACGRAPSSASGPIEKSNAAPARSVDSSDQVTDPETQEMVRRGKEIIAERRDCIVSSLPQEVVSLRRGVPTYVERPVSNDDPRRSTILGFRAANTDILREAADRVKDDSPAGQARALQLTYLALAKTDLKLSKESGGTVKTDLVDSVKCWVVKYISLAVILDDMRDQDRDRNNRKRVSWAPGIEV